ncbi:hypothetical protein DYBT9275_03044 [Dyadobacter sp. CECT 9275]|uniref:Uncharacterized protein n=1 Tax=Dyadobacter helix TaxID=2822344 RepID=A0A916JD87_9BACT|nr:hypothetical protein [Dyadobacter sp. CECT 9275]CAG5003076.1 hypothetical protein DYBT9275_03044 [Dyadobacter sp. CECT 9275]
MENPDEKDPQEMSTSELIGEMKEIADNLHELSMDLLKENEQLKIKAAHQEVLKSTEQ